MFIQFTYLTFLPARIGSHQGPHEKRLLNNLLNNYNILERPVSNETEALSVRFGLTLQQIIDVVRTLEHFEYVTSFRSLILLCG